jgi:hypothetical protein
MTGLKGRRTPSGDVELCRGTGLCTHGGKRKPRRKNACMARPLSPAGRWRNKRAHPRYYGPARQVIMSSGGISRGSVILSEFSIRMPCEDDWPAILNLANQSLMEVPYAPSQQEWLENRRSYSPSEGIQRHIVATSGDQIVGYACIEHRDNFKLHPPAINAPHGEYRLFVVVAPSDRSTLGPRLLKLLGRQLIELGALRAWTTEYEADAHFVSYLEQMGFVRQTSFRLPDGTTAVRLIMDAPFQSLAAAEES